MPDLPVLHVCSLDTAGGPIHPCAKAEKALEEAGVEHTRNIFDRNRPMGLFTAGKRPELKAMSGQEKLPVLELTDGSTVNGSGDIVKWAKGHAKA